MTTTTDKRTHQPWRPEWRDGTTLSKGYESLSTEITPTSMLMDAAMSIGQQQSLYRALQINGMENILLEVSTDQADQEWYQALRTVDQVTTVVTTEEGEEFIMSFEPETEDSNGEPDFRELEGKRTVSIIHVLYVTDPQGRKDTAEVPGDLAIREDDDDPMEYEPVIVVTHDTTIERNELVHILMDTCHVNCEDPYGPSYDDQEYQSRRQLTTLAIKVLQSEDDAVREALEYAADNHVQNHVPRGWAATITVDAQGKYNVAIIKPEG